MKRKFEVTDDLIDNFVIFDEGDDAHLACAQKTRQWLCLVDFLDYLGPIALDNLIVPSICLYEVFRVVLRERNENDALQAIALMKQGKVVDLTAEIALEAAKISFDNKIPMEDSIVLATAWTYEATIWTLDSDFEKFSGVKYFSRKNS